MRRRSGKKRRGPSPQPGQEVTCTTSTSRSPIMMQGVPVAKATLQMCPSPFETVLNADRTEVKEAPRFSWRTIRSRRKRVCVAPPPAASRLPVHRPAEWLAQCPDFLLLLIQCLPSQEASVIAAPCWWVQPPSTKPSGRARRTGTNQRDCGHVSLSFCLSE